LALVNAVLPIAGLLVGVLRADGLKWLHFTRVPGSVPAVEAPVSKPGFINNLLFQYHGLWRPAARPLPDVVSQRHGVQHAACRRATTISHHCWPVIFIFTRLNAIFPAEPRDVLRHQAFIGA